MILMGTCVIDGVLMCSDNFPKVRRTLVLRKYISLQLSLFVVLLLPYASSAFRSHAVRNCRPFSSSVWQSRERYGTRAATLDSEFGRIILQPSADETNSVLHRLLKEEDDTTLISVEGFISKRRALSSSLVFLDIVISEDESIPPVQALLRREFYENVQNNDKPFKAYQKVLQPGTHVSLLGHVGPSRNPGEVLLFAHRAMFLTPNSNPQHMKNVLRLVDMGDLSLDEFASALNMDSKDLEQQLENKGDKDDEYYDKLGRQILSGMSDLLDPARLMGSSGSAKIKMLPPVPSEITKALELVPKDTGPESETFGSQGTTSVVEMLENSRYQSNAFNETITISGWVRNRRRFNDSVTVIEVVDEYAPQDEESKESGKIILSADKSRLKCVLHPSVMRDGREANAPDFSATGEKKAVVNPVDMYGGILCAGSRVTLQGFVVKENDTGDDRASLWVTNARLLRSSWRPKVVRQIVELVRKSEIDMEEAAQALELEGGIQEAEDMAETKDLTERQWLAAEISRRLQDETSRLKKVTPEMEMMLQNSEELRSEFPLSDEATGKKSIGSTYFEEKVVGAQVKKSFAGSRWQRKKRPQLDWMIEQVEEVIQCYPGNLPLKVVDVGGGKGYLAGLIAEHFGNDVVDVRVVDICSKAIKNGMMRARKRNLDNINFTVGDAQVDVELGSVDIVVALHACGALSDVAIGHAVTNGAAFVVCPCCFRSNPHLRVTIPFLGSEDSTSRSQDAGTKVAKRLVSVPEWLGIDSEDLETLKHIAEIQGDVNLAGQAMHAICALRAKAAKRYTQKHQESGITPHLDVELKRFPIGLSTRNICIVGKMSKVA